jgi:hypothetical protein
MSALELIGAATIYVAAVAIAGYVGGLVTVFCARDKGLAAVAPAILIAGGIWFIGAVVCLVLLGAHL